MKFEVLGVGLINPTIGFLQPGALCLGQGRACNGPRRAAELKASKSKTESKDSAKRVAVPAFANLSLQKQSCFGVYEIHLYQKLSFVGKCHRDAKSHQRLLKTVLFELPFQEQKLPSGGHSGCPPASNKFGNTSFCKDSAQL